MRNILNSPVVDDALVSTLLAQLSGSLISNQPKNDSANTISRTNRKMLKYAFVDSSLSLLGPAMTVTRMPSARKMTTMDMPYITASMTPFRLSPCARFRKKLTVMGMIGQMQGITRANSPPTIPIKKIYNSPFPAISLLVLTAFSSSTTGAHRSEPASTAVLSIADSTTASAFSSSSWVVASGLSSAFASSSALTPLSMAGLLPAFFNSTSEGGRQFWSLQAPYVR